MSAVELSQRLPQRPQLLVSLAVLMQLPPQQVLPAPHAFPQRPQFVASVLRSVQKRPQHAWLERHVVVPQRHVPRSQVSPVRHAGVHGMSSVQLPSRQTSAPVHVTPQPPQLDASFIVLAQEPPQHDSPLAAQAGPAPHMQVMPTHSSPTAQAGSHGAITQVPASQFIPAPHAIPQPPQLSRSFIVSWQPSSQQVSVPVHCGWKAQRHWPAEHVLPVGKQERPHRPQWFTSLGSSTHEPSQQLVPIGHADPLPQPTTQRPSVQT